MKRFAVLSALLLFSSVSHAQNAPSDSAKNAVPSAGTDDARMKALEEQVRSLAGEVALLRSELKEFRESKSPEQLSSPQLLLASTHPQPGTLASVPAPAAPQTTQTQTFGGASGNAKYWHGRTEQRFAFTFAPDARNRGRHAGHHRSLRARRCLPLLR